MLELRCRQLTGGGHASRMESTVSLSNLPLITKVRLLLPGWPGRAHEPRQPHATTQWWRPLRLAPLRPALPPTRRGPLPPTAMLTSTGSGTAASGSAPQDVLHELPSPTSLQLPARSDPASVLSTSASPRRGPQPPPSPQLLRPAPGPHPSPVPAPASAPGAGGRAGRQAPHYLRQKAALQSTGTATAVTDEEGDDGADNASLSPPLSSPPAYDVSKTTITTINSTSRASQSPPPPRRLPAGVLSRIRQADLPEWLLIVRQYGKSSDPSGRFSADALFRAAHFVDNGGQPAGILPPPPVRRSMAVLAAAERTQASGSKDQDQGQEEQQYAGGGDDVEQLSELCAQLLPTVTAAAAAAGGLSEKRLCRLLWALGKLAGSGGEGQSDRSMVGALGQVAATSRERETVRRGGGGDCSNRHHQQGESQGPRHQRPVLHDSVMQDQGRVCVAVLTEQLLAACRTASSYPEPHVAAGRGLRLGEREGEGRGEWSASTTTTPPPSNHAPQPYHTPGDEEPLSGRLLVMAMWGLARLSAAGYVPTHGLPPLSASPAASTITHSPLGAHSAATFPDPGVLWAALCGALEPRLSGLAAREVSNALWALGAVRRCRHAVFGRLMGEMGRQLAAATAVAVATGRPIPAAGGDCNVQDLANTVWALARSTPDPDPALFRTLDAAVRAALPQLRAQHVASLLWSLRVMRFRPPPPLPPPSLHAPQQLPQQCPQEPLPLQAPQPLSQPQQRPQRPLQAPQPSPPSSLASHASSSSSYGAVPREGHSQGLPQSAAAAVGVGTMDVGPRAGGAGAGVGRLPLGWTTASSSPGQLVCGELPGGVRLDVFGLLAVRAGELRVVEVAEEGIVAQTIWSLVGAGRAGGWLLAPAARRLAAAGAAGRLTLREAAMVAAAYRDARFADADLFSGLLVAARRRSQRQLDEPHSEVSIALLLRGLAWAGCYDKAVFDHLSATLHRRLHSIDPQPLAMALWALAAARHSPAPSFLTAVTTLATALVRQFSGLELSNVVLSLARLGVRNADFYDAAAVTLTELRGSGKGGVGPRKRCKKRKGGDGGEEGKEAVAPRREKLIPGEPPTRLREGNGEEEEDDDDDDFELEDVDGEDYEDYDSEDEDDEEEEVEVEEQQQQKEMSNIGVTPLPGPTNRIKRQQQQQPRGRYRGGKRLWLVRVQHPDRGTPRWRLIDLLKPLELGNVMAGFALAGHVDETLFFRAEVRAARLIKASTVLRNQAASQAVASGSGGADNTGAATAAAAALRRGDPIAPIDLSAGAVVKLLWAFVMAGDHQAPLLRLLAGRLRQLVHRLEPRDVAALSWALATARLEGCGDLMANAVRAAGRHAAAFAPADLATVAWAAASVGLGDRELMGACAELVMRGNGWSGEEGGEGVGKRRSGRSGGVDGVDGEKFVGRFGNEQVGFEVEVEEEEEEEDLDQVANLGLVSHCPAKPIGGEGGGDGGNAGSSRRFPRPLPAGLLPGGRLSLAVLADVAWAHSALRVYDSALMARTAELAAPQLAAAAAEAAADGAGTPPDDDTSREGGAAAKAAGAAPEKWKCSPEEEVHVELHHVVSLLEALTTWAQIPPLPHEHYHHHGDDGGNYSGGHQGQGKNAGAGAFSSHKATRINRALGGSVSVCCYHDGLFRSAARLLLARVHELSTEQVVSVTWCCARVLSAVALTRSPSGHPVVELLGALSGVLGASRPDCFLPGELTQLAQAVALARQYGSAMAAARSAGGAGGGGVDDGDDAERGDAGQQEGGGRGGGGDDVRRDCWCPLVLPPGLESRLEGAWTAAPARYLRRAVVELCTALEEQPGGGGGSGAGGGGGGGRDCFRDVWINVWCDKAGAPVDVAAWGPRIATWGDGGGVVAAGMSGESALGPGVVGSRSSVGRGVRSVGVGYGGMGGGERGGMGEVRYAFLLVSPEAQAEGVGGGQEEEGVFRGSVSVKAQLLRGAGWRVVVLRLPGAGGSRWLGGVWGGGEWGSAKEVREQVRQALKQALGKV